MKGLTTMNDDIEKARAAHAALIAAKAACDAAGLTITCGMMRREHDSADAVVACMDRAAEKIASMGRRALPIAFGDEVRIGDVNAGRRAPQKFYVSRVGRTLVYIVGENERESPFTLDGGRENDGYGHRWIVPDDLARIKRDLVGKRPPKPAPTLREVATVTTAAKGDDE